MSALISGRSAVVPTRSYGDPVGCEGAPDVAVAAAIRQGRGRSGPVRCGGDGDERAGVVEGVGERLAARRFLGVGAGVPRFGECHDVVTSRSPGSSVL
jgi:hypothetical protein